MVKGIGCWGNKRKMKYLTAYKGKRLPSTLYRYPLGEYNLGLNPSPSIYEVLSLFGINTFGSDIFEDGILLPNGIEVKKAWNGLLKIKITFIPTNIYLDNRQRTCIDLILNHDGEFRKSSTFSDIVLGRRSKRGDDRKLFKEMSSREIYFDIKFGQIIQFTIEHNLNLYNDFHLIYLAQERERTLELLGI